jgi:integrase/recombinase XerD
LWDGRRASPSKSHPPQASKNGGLRIKRRPKMEKNNTLTQRTNLKIYQETDLYTWIEAFLIDRKAQNLSSGTLKFYQNKLRVFMDFCDSQLISEVIELNPNNLRQFILYLRENHNPGGVHTIYRSIKAFLFWYENEVEPDNWKNPIRKIKAPKLPEKILNPASLEEIFVMVDTCKSNKFTNIRDKAILLFLLDTGLRAMEFINLNIEDVNFITGEIFIHQGKGRKSRTVFLGKKSRKVVRRYLKYRTDNNPALWITNSTVRISYGGLRGIITRRAKLAGINPLPLHSFRRAFAINALRADVNIYSLQALMGHKYLSVLQRYPKISEVDLRIAQTKGSPVDNNRL